ncbi:MAG TPA: hypothetical protein VJZ27_01635, partial [Aggregatilineales bacterium]|nr:hypothetical protein [Aggregatilineales bacterium]
VRPYLSTVLIITVYLLYALVWMRPVLSSEKLIGDNSIGGVSFWTTWFPAHAFENNINLVQNHYTLYPVETNILPLLSLPTSALYYLIRIFAGKLLAFNLLFPLYLTLTASSSFLFLRTQIRNELMAGIGGFALAFNPITVLLVNRGEIALLGFFLFPLWMLLWDRFMQAPSARHTGMLVILTWVIVLLSVQYWNLIAGCLIPYAVYQFWHKEKSESDLLINHMAIGGLMLAVLCLIFPIPAMLQSTYGQRYLPLEIWQGAVIFDRSLIILAVTGIIALLLSLVADWQFIPDRQLWVGIIALNVLLFSRNDFAPLSLIGSIFSIPDNPDLTQPVMFLFPAIFAAIVLVLKMFDSAFQGFTFRWRVITGLLLIAALLWTSDFEKPLSSMPITRYDFLETIAADPENYTIVDFPVGVDTLAYRSTPNEIPVGIGFSDDAGRALSYVPFHEKQVVGGIASNLTPEQLQVYTEAPLIRLLTFQPQDDVVESVIHLRREVVQWRVGYILLHTGIVPPEFENALRGWLNWTGAFCMVGQEQDVEYWRGMWHPAGCPAYHVDFGGAASDMALVEGWYAPEWWVDRIAVRASGEMPAQVLLWVNPTGYDFDLTLRVTAPEAITAQNVTIMVNGSSIGSFAPSAEWDEYILTLPRQLIGSDGLLRLELHHSSAEVIEGRSLAAVYEYIEIHSQNLESE